MLITVIRVFTPALLCIAWSAECAAQVNADQVPGASAQVTRQAIDRLAHDLVLSEAQRVFVDTEFRAYQQQLSNTIEMQKQVITAWEVAYLRERWPDVTNSLNVSPECESDDRRNLLAMGVAVIDGDRVIGTDLDAVVARNAKVVELEELARDAEESAREHLRSALAAVLADEQLAALPWAWNRLDITSLDARFLGTHAFPEPRRRIDMLSLLDTNVLRNPRVAEVLNGLDELKALIRGFELTYRTKLHEYDRRYRRDRGQLSLLHNTGQSEEAGRVRAQLQRRKASVWDARLRIVHDVSDWLERHVSTDAAIEWRQSAFRAFCPSVYADDAVDHLMRRLRAMDDGVVPRTCEELFQSFASWRVQRREELTKSLIDAACSEQFIARLSESRDYDEVYRIWRSLEREAEATCNLIVAEFDDPDREAVLSILVEAADQMNGQPSAFRRLRQ